MKILVISDNHGKTENMKKILATETYDKSIHCGDFLMPDKEILAMFDYVVCGNNDYGSTIQDDIFIRIGGIKIFLTHGDMYPPIFKTGEGVSHRKVLNKYQEEGIDIIIHGHTHIPRKQMTPDTLITCPGSIDFPRGGSEKSYSIIEVKKDKEIIIKHKTL